VTVTIARRLTHFNHALAYEAIPTAVIEKAKLLILDTLGVCIGSTRLEFGRAATALVAGWGGPPQATVIGARDRVAAHNAAFANGILGHGQDYDDTHTESVVHPSAALVPAALAEAERSKRSGRETLAALIAGTEATIRLALPAFNRFHLRGFHTTSITATFGAALISARLRGMSEEGAHQAVGVGGSFTSGLLECVPAAAGAKRLHAGWAALCGFVAADMAQSGFTGPATVFEGKLGVYNSFLRDEPLDLALIFDRIGERWEILNTRPKLYPCCHYLQSFLDCAARLRRDHDIRSDDVAKIECRIAAGAVNIVCDPWPRKLDPRTGYDARFSLPFAVALMLARGKAGTAEFSETTLGDPAVRALMPKVSYEVEPRYEVKDMPGWVRVTLGNGTQHTAEIPAVRGDAANPVPQDELLVKFHANTEFLGRGASQRIAEQILALDQCADVGVLMAALRAAPATAVAA
jgi:2-methylcitrate dehydratase PrpD